MKIAVLPGDGIGPEVVEAALPVVEALGLPWELRFGEIGWSCWRRGGDPVPEATWRLVEESDGGLLGAVTSKPEREAQAELDPELRGRGLAYVSPVVQLRQRLDLYANLRPAADFLGSPPRFDYAIVRENTEGLYAGFDVADVHGELWELVRRHPNAARSGPEGVRVALRLQTDVGTDRILRFAFELARREGRTSLVVADKPNILRASGQHLRERLALVAPDYPEVAAEVQNADAVAMRLVADPGGFGVVVAENLLGDVLSDVAAGVSGGLGLAPSGNVGERWSYFEPVHGSAPDIAGQGVANPLGTILSIAGLAEHLGSRDEADALRRAVRTVVARGEHVTPDLGGGATTGQAARAVIAALG
ncbi:MAG: isocitrate/isopropylmalate dehydrogenase family protein [Segniliparus sp.]|uniref:isocitrate/isopropylmalate dehydrogenase family protein n=1 Tax=Segniliparus sp. TaxID=2804064 RepID=UPI003F3EAD6D